uniref:Uncharacterized protein n=1 Tax=Strombidium rassoulzadegani TaxID=1082188 RepID=A0A7S3FX83_9SPIT
MRMGAHAVLGDVLPARVQAVRGEAVGVDVDVLVVLAVPALIVDVEQVLAVRGLQDEFHCRLAPDKLGIHEVDLVPRLHLEDDMAVEPLAILLRALAPALELILAAQILLGLDHQFDRVVDLERGVEHLPPDVLPALRALLAPHQALTNALVAERVAASRRSAPNDQVHADRARQSLDLLE